MCMNFAKIMSQVSFYDSARFQEMFFICDSYAV